MHANLCILFVLFFKRLFCNGPETELECKIGFRTYIIFAFYHIQTDGAWSLLALMYPATVHIMCASVLATRITNSLIYRLLNDVVLCGGVESGVHSKNITLSQIEFL